MGAGRPTDYKQEYCDKLVKHMTEGYSFESFAGLIGVNRDTLYAWVKTHEEFSDAKKRGFDASRLTWEGIGIKMAKTGQGNATAFVFNMKNRFPEDWRDKQDFDHTTKGQAISQPTTIVFTNGSKGAATEA